MARKVAGRISFPGGTGRRGAGRGPRTDRHCRHRRGPTGPSGIRRCSARSGRGDQGAPRVRVGRCPPGAVGGRAGRRSRANSGETTWMSVIARRSATWVSLTSRSRRHRRAGAVRPHTARRRRRHQAEVHVEDDVAGEGDEEMFAPGIRARSTSRPSSSAATSTNRPSGCWRAGPSRRRPRRGSRQGDGRVTWHGR